MFEYFVKHACFVGVVSELGFGNREVPEASDISRIDLGDLATR